jgi:hypothetical protein
VDIDEEIKKQELMEAAMARERMHRRLLDFRQQQVAKEYILPFERQGYAQDETDIKLVRDVAPVLSCRADIVF